MDAPATPTRRQIFIKEAAFILNRREDTLRKWETKGALPEHLRPQRASRGWRWWTVEQLDEIKEWMKTRPIGHALPHYTPNEQASKIAVSNMRRPRYPTIVKLWMEGKLDAHLQPTITEYGLEWTERQVEEIADIAGVEKSSIRPRYDKRRAAYAARAEGNRRAVLADSQSD